MKGGLKGGGKSERTSLTSLCSSRLDGHNGWMLWPNWGGGDGEQRTRGFSGLMRGFWLGGLEKWMDEGGRERDNGRPVEEEGSTK